MVSVTNENDTHQEGSFGGICLTPHTLKLPVIPTVMSWFAYLALVGLGVPAGTMTNGRVWKLLGNKMHLSVQNSMSHTKC